MGTFEQRFGRGLILALFGVFSLAAVALAVGMISSGVQLFLVLWLGAYLWNGYWWLLRIATKVEVDRTEVRWEAPLRSGVVPLGDITSVKPVSVLGPSAPVAIRHAGGSSILVLPAKGIEELVAAIAGHRPDITARIGVVSRWQGRMKGPSAWREGPTGS